MASLAPRTLILCLGLTACPSDDEGDSTGADTGMSTTAPSTDPSGDASAGPTTNPSTDPGDASSSAADSGDDDPGTSSDAGETNGSTGEPGTGDTSTGGGPTSGPGVLPGESGLEAFCRRYVECGGTYYADQQDCIDASTGYWGECASRIEAQDNFGACMSEIECRDWSPDAYNPASTPCAEQWQQLGASEPC